MRRWIVVVLAALMAVVGVTLLTAPAQSRTTATPEVATTVDLVHGTWRHRLHRAKPCHHHRCPTTSTTSTSSTTTSSTTSSTSPTTSTSSTSTGPTTSTSTTSTTTSSTTSTTSSTTATSPSSWKCSVALGGVCGPYSGNPNSNGFNTYVSNQNVGAQSGTTQTLNANSISDWQVVSNSVPYGYGGVQSYPDVQQLFNNWCGSTTNWSSCQSPTDTPLASLPSLSVRYAETSPTGPNDLYQFSPDLWLDNYGSDIMFWVDIKGRCNEGAFGPTVLGHATFGGQNWTVHRYGGPGDEIIFVLDGAGGSGTCAQQKSGTIDIKAGVQWLIDNGYVQSGPKITQLNTGWEITSADHATFRVTDYAIQIG